MSSDGSGRSGLRVYSDHGTASLENLVIASVGYRNSWGFKAMLVIVADPRAYRGGLDGVILQARSLEDVVKAEVISRVATTIC
mmetsp:Transcript_55638/g.146815  ORF Transcript_55638/g.146815 Transcript_55638/m.146815 type:complete len:83 (+) Transcript_55638:753-1001(+)